jgi:hypothetical protein
MKGDFTQRKFDRTKHFTSVLMQQGRVQLDADWNEKEEIHRHYLKAQLLAAVGDANGVPTYNPITGEVDNASFQTTLIADDDANATVTDLAIAPGHLYVNGTLCELEGTRFAAKVISNDQTSFVVEVLSPVVDGRFLQAQEWLQEVDDENRAPRVFQITQIDNRRLTLRLGQADPAIQSGDAIQFRRLLTYKSQPDYPNPPSPETSGWYMAYVDVWQRHITTVEDPSLREVALNLPDTTTRTKTVWQLKLLLIPDSQELGEYDLELKSLDGVEELPEEGKYLVIVAKIGSLYHVRIFDKTGQKIDKGAGEFSPDERLAQQLDSALASQPIDKATKRLLIKQIASVLNYTLADNLLDVALEQWEAFVRDEKNRINNLSLTAWAKLQPTDGNVPTVTEGYSRQENQLYRVEIHNESPADNAAGATFKWSRDNGSIVSPIIKLEGRFITIPKSSQDAWADSKPGQWIEITNEEQDLKGQPGALARLKRATDTRLEFDESGIEGEIPTNPTKVRRWDHMTPEAAIPIEGFGIPLEEGIKVSFNETGQYRTGDYWLIPARAAKSDILWPNDQTADNPQPLPQPPLGIHHDRCLLALVYVNQENAGNWKFDLNRPVDDQRNVFTSLMRTIGPAGGTITGTLKVRDLLTDNFASSKFRGQKLELASDPLSPGGDIFGAIQAHETAQGNKQIEFVADSVGVDFAFLDGNVGIGQNASAEYVLDVNGTINGTTLLQDGAPVALQSVLTTHLETPNPHGITAADLGAFPADGGQIAGNVGINTPATETYALDVLGTLNATTLLQGGNTVALQSALADHLETENPHGITAADLGAFPADGGQIAGNVGINTPVTETYALNVLGSINATALLQDGAPVALQSALTTHLETENPHGITTADLGAFPADGGQIAGNVGINTPVTETYALNVLGSINATALLQDGAPVALQSALTTHLETSNPHGITAADLGAFPADGGQIAGNVGINTPAVETYALDVLGILNATTLFQDGVPVALQSGTVSVEGGKLSGNLGVGLDPEDDSVQPVARCHARAAQFIPPAPPTARITAFGTNPDDTFNRAQIIVNNDATDLQRGYLISIDVGDGDRLVRSLTQITGTTLTLNEALPDTLTIPAGGWSFEVQQEVIMRLEDPDGNAQFVVLANGQTGIGTPSPKAELEVNGAIQASELRVGKIFSDDVATVDLEAGTVVAAQQVIAPDFYQLSSQVLKEDVTKLSSPVASRLLDDLYPVTFRYKHDPDHNLHAGFIAENVPDLLRAPVSEPPAIKLSDVVAILTRAVKDQRQVIKSDRKLLSEVTKVVKKQQTEIANLTRKLELLAAKIPDI